MGAFGSSPFGMNAFGTGNSGSHSLAVPFLGQIAGQVNLCTNIASGGQQIMMRSRHISRDTITTLQVAYPNFYVNNSTFTETGPGGIATITAAIEYPIGSTCTQIKWSGAASHTIADGAMGILSDVVSVSIPINTPFMIRTYMTNPAQTVCVNKGNIVDNSQSFRFAASGLSDQTMTPGSPTGGTSSPNFRYTPLLIVASTSVASVLILGDSRQEGSASGEFYTGTSDDIGEVARSIGPNFAYCNLGKGSDTCSLFLASKTNRVSLGNYFSHIICPYGVNDIANDLKTPAQVITLLKTVRNQFPSRKFFQCTIAPETTSTDFFTTTQTQRASSANIIALNALIRAGQVGDGYFELADNMESARDSGLWITSSGARVVTDAAGTNLSTTVTSVTANFTAADTGLVLVCAALGHTSALGRTMTFVNSTTVTMSANSTATLTGQTASIQAQRYTLDGIHETAEANINMAATRTFDKARIVVPY